MLFWIVIVSVLTWQFVIYEPPPVMSRAEVLTHPACAKFSSELAVATCEQIHPTLVVPLSSSDSNSLE